MFNRKARERILAKSKAANKSYGLKVQEARLRRDVSAIFELPTVPQVQQTKHRQTIRARSFVSPHPARSRDRACLWQTSRPASGADCSTISGAPSRECVR